MTKKSVVLLSGGMDSATALWWAKKYTEVKGCLFIRYGQMGEQYEEDSCVKLFLACFPDWYGGCPTHIQRYSIEVPGQSALKGDTVHGFPDLDGKLDDGLPKSYVPARNLIFIAMAASWAYTLGANTIVGGWTRVDNDYPDCKEAFLREAETAASLSLSYDIGHISINAPVLHRTKAGIVKYGTELGVPWELTRSCYYNQPHHCGRCDSCIKRAQGFYDSGMRDPAYTRIDWSTRMLTVLTIRRAP